MGLSHYRADNMVIILVLCLGLLATPVSSFCPAGNDNHKLACPPRRILGSPTGSTTTAASRIELSMGLRSFISKKVRGNKEEPSDNNNNNNNKKKKAPAAPTKAATSKQGTEATATARKTATEKQQQAQKAAGLAAMNKVPNNSNTKKVTRMGTDPTTGEIDVATQLGPETVQERIQRIKRGDMSHSEKEAFLKSALSTGATPESRLPMMTSSSASSQSSSASPFPTDSILRNMAMGSKAGDKDDAALLEQQQPVMDSQSKKQQYLDMVTDPNRFQTYQSGGSASKSNDALVEEDDKVAVPVPNIPVDLGARLGAAAMEDEKRQKELRAQREVQDKTVERQRLEREKRLAEATRQRQDELAQREAELIQRRKAEETKAQQELQRKQQEQESRQAEMMKAQDDYWTRKLAAEKQGATKATVEEEVEEEEEQVEEEEGIEAEEESPIDVEVEEAPELATLDSLNDVSPSAGNGMINRAASEVFGRNPLNDVAGRTPLNDVPTTRDSILSDVARKKADREREQQSQMERLKSLNSPLPTSNKNTAPGNARPGRPKSNFQPQMSVNAARKQTPLNDLTKTIQNAVVDSKAAEAEAAVAAAESKKSKSSSFSNPFARLTGPKKDTPKPAPVSAPTPPPPPAAVSPPPPRPAPAPRAPPPAPAKRSGPIRMELPLGDEEDEEEEGAMTDGMTIGEIMKRQQSSGGADQGARSKQWGVDMSRFKE